LFGSTRLTVGGDMFVAVVLGAGATASGRVVFDGTSPVPPITDRDDQRLSISFTPADGRCRLGRVFFGADLTFSVDGLIGTCATRTGRAAAT